MIPLEFCKRWFGFADFKEMLGDIEEYYRMHIPVRDAIVYSRDGMYIPFVTRPEAPSDTMLKPFSYLEEGEMIKPFQTYDDSKIAFINNTLNECIS